MKILEVYLWKTLLSSIVITWFALVSLDSFFTYLGELSDTDPDTHYGALQALIYIGYLVPRSLYNFFPMAALIGALMGLGQLAASSELIAMRAAGVSIRNIMFSTLKLGLIIATFIFIFGEWVTPVAELQGKSFKLEKQDIGPAYTRAGVWVKEGKNIVHINNVWSENKLSGISIFLVDKDKGELVKVTKAKKALKKDNMWNLYDVKVITIHKDRIDIDMDSHKEIPNLISDKFMKVTSVEPSHLSITELSSYIQHQSDNDLNTKRLEQAYWQRFSLPFSTLAMLIIAMPFAFGSQRNAGAGQRLFVGILIGIVFILINQAVSSMGLVYGFSPIFSTFSPLLLFLTIGLVMLKRVR